MGQVATSPQQSRQAQALGLTASVLLLHPECQVESAASKIETRINQVFSAQALQRHNFRTQV